METSQETGLFKTGSLIADRYEVIKTLGAGGVGMVLQVIDRTLDNEVIALKLLFPHLARDRTQFARFRNEVLIARKLGHPNIVRLYDFGIAGRGYYYLSMEFVSGGSLGQRIYGMRQDRLRFDETLKILYEICQGLSCAHRMGIVHRDLKPDNVLLTELNHVKISDFGLARSLSVDKGFTDTGETVGTPYYMAPEQLTGQPPDSRMDIYSLGIIGYELAVGRRPFFHENYIDLANMHLYEEIPDFADRESGIPQWYEEWVHTCGAKRREDRFQTAEEAGRMLLEHMDDSQNTTVRRVPTVLSFYSPRKWRKDLRKTKRLRVLATKVIIASIFSILVGAYLALSQTVTSGDLIGSLGMKPMVFGFRGDPSANMGENDEQKRIGQQDFAQRNFKRFAGLLNASPDFHANLQSGDVVPPLGNQLQRLLYPLKTYWAQHFSVPATTEKTEGDLATARSYSLLALAILHRNLQAASLLISQGADVNTRQANGLTPFLMAAKLGQADIIQVMLSSGSPAPGVTEESTGRTALHLAVLENQVQVVRNLIGRGFPVNSPDSSGATALLYAVRNANVEMVSIIRSAETDLDLADLNGETPLIAAVKAQNIPIVQQLVNSGARVDVRDKSGKTAEQYATREIRNVLSTSRAGTPEFHSSGSSLSGNGTNATIVAPGTAPRTTVRVIGDLLVSPYSAGRVVGHSVKVRVRNVGEEAAEGIVVVLKTGPSSGDHMLMGPSYLERNSEAEYMGTVEGLAALNPSGRDIEVRCRNCVKR